MKRTLPYAIYTGIALILYFLIMKLLGLETNFYLRIFNFFIMTGGIYFLLRNSIRRSDESIGYLDGLRMGLQFTIISVLIFIAFLGLYLKFFDRSFLNVMQDSGLWASENVTISQASIGVFIEGIASGLIITFAWMQYFKSYIKGEDSA